MSKNTNASTWKAIDRWNLGDWDDGAELMIVENDGTRCLLVKCRADVAVPPTWRLAIKLLGSDTRETLMADAGLACPMSVFDRAREGYDSDRPIMFGWSAGLVHNIANAAK